MNLNCKRKECDKCKYSKDEFIIRLMKILGPVILKVKPSEILSFSKSEKNYDENLKKIEEVFGECTEIKYRIVDFNRKGKKVLFYRESELNNTLSDKKNLKFLKSIGYPFSYTLNKYLNFIENKISNGIIPDEIGIFLGYPLKDVLGFMGHPSLKLTKINGWRVYGDSLLSDIKYNQFKNAKENIKILLSYSSVSEILYI